MVSNRDAAVQETVARSNERSRSREADNFQGHMQRRQRTYQQRNYDHCRPERPQPPPQQYSYYGPGGPSLPEEHRESDHRESDRDNRKRDRDGERKQSPISPVTFYFHTDTQNPTQQEVDEFFRQKPVLHFKEIPSIFMSAVSWKKKHNIDVLSDDNLAFVTESIMNMLSQVEGMQFVNAGHLIKLTVSVVTGLPTIASTNIHLTGHSWVVDVVYLLSLMIIQPCFFVLDILFLLLNSTLFWTHVPPVCVVFMLKHVLVARSTQRCSCPDEVVL